ncbi:MAG: PIN domain-containing protein [Caldilineaceae bacterium]
MSDKLGYQFVDTNVLVYAHDRGSGIKHVIARQLIQQLWNDLAGCLSIQVFQEFYVNITRKAKSPLTIAETVQHITDLSEWKIHVPDISDLLNAIEIQKRYQISFWDALIIHSALQLGCECIWSEDLNSGQVYEGIRVVNPFAKPAE